VKLLKPVLLSLLCAALLVLVNTGTTDAIQRNRAFHAEKLVREMAAPYAVTQSDEVYVLADDKAGAAGWVRPVTAEQGYNGPIKLLVAYLDTGVVLNVRVTEHRETPGLGDAIEPGVSDWILQFSGRQLAGTDWQVSPAGDIDGISGATITAKAVADAVRETLENELAP